MNDEQRIYREALERLARGKEILVLDDLAKAAENLRVELDKQVGQFREAGVPTEESIAAFLDDDRSGSFIALGLPIATYGGPQSLRALGAALAHVGRAAVSESGGYVVHGEAGIAILGRMLWALTAQGLVAGNPQILKVAQSTRLPMGSYGMTPSMSEDHRLRYATTLGGNATRTYEHYRDWLVSNQIILDACPYLAADPETGLRTADALLALAMVESGQGKPYAHGIYDRTVAARIVALAKSSPAEVAQFLNVNESGLLGEIQRRAELVNGLNSQWNDSPFPGLIGAE